MRVELLRVVMTVRYPKVHGPLCYVIHSSFNAEYLGFFFSLPVYMRQLSFILFPALKRCEVNMRQSCASYSLELEKKTELLKQN